MAPVTVINQPKWGLPLSIVWSIRHVEDRKFAAIRSLLMLQAWCHPRFVWLTCRRRCIYVEVGVARFSVLVDKSLKLPIIMHGIYRILAREPSRCSTTAETIWGSLEMFGRSAWTMAIYQYCAQTTVFIRLAHVGATAGSTVTSRRSGSAS